MGGFQRYADKVLRHQLIYDPFMLDGILNHHTSNMSSFLSQIYIYLEEFSSTIYTYNNKCTTYKSQYCKKNIEIFRYFHDEQVFSILDVRLYYDNLLVVVVRETKYFVVVS